MLAIVRDGMGWDRMGWDAMWLEGKDWKGCGVSQLKIYVTSYGT